MSIENRITDLNNTPQVFLDKIVFNDDTEISLNHNSIIVFTGSNNCGKTQVLKDIEIFLNETNSNPTVVIKNIKSSFLGDINHEEFIKDRFSTTPQGHYKMYDTNISFDEQTLLNAWKYNRLPNYLHRLFVKRLDTTYRLSTSNDLNRNQDPEKHPVYRLIYNDNLATGLSNYFRQAFGVDIVVNRNEIKTVPLHVGIAPDKTAFTIAQQDEYYKAVSSLPKLQEQGDGMRSFATIILDVFTSNYPITLIDEPEAFLHPPQARILGKILAQNTELDRQFLISTHSEDFLQGLIDANNDNVTIIRIDRVDALNKMSVLNNSEIKELWSNPLLRYSNILSGLFHEKVIVCESDYDCLFYNAVMDAIYENGEKSSPDILFTHCGGKYRAKDIVKALKAVNVPVVAVCDFDLLNSSKTFSSIIEAFKLDWKEDLEVDMKIIYDTMNSKTGSWDNIKNIGKDGFWGKAPAAYEKVEQICKKVGLFVIPVGEIESFDKTINKQKKEWVYEIFEKYDLATEPKLEKARAFVQELVNFS